MQMLKYGIFMIAPSLFSPPALLYLPPRKTDRENGITYGFSLNRTVDLPSFSARVSPSSHLLLAGEGRVWGGDPMDLNALILVCGWLPACEPYIKRHLIAGSDESKKNMVGKNN
jgi:hypothetical protein